MSLIIVIIVVDNFGKLSGGAKCSGPWHGQTGRQTTTAVWPQTHSTSQQSFDFLYIIAVDWYEARIEKFTIPTPHIKGKTWIFGCKSIQSGRQDKSAVAFLWFLSRQHILALPYWSSCKMDWLPVFRGFERRFGRFCLNYLRVFLTVVLDPPIVTRWKSYN